jgi:hypothetical protein
MNGIYPGAEWKPLANPQPPGLGGDGKPRVLIFHTMVGNLEGTDSYFRHGNGEGYSGTESHFGIGGPHDGPLDGAVWQWTSLLSQADAQYSGNVYGTSVETADGGDPRNPWSPAQLAAMIRLGVWWCRTFGRPAVLVPTADAFGIGYHSQFYTWNQSGHICPGDVRIRQLTRDVIPGIAGVLKGGAHRLYSLTRVLYDGVTGNDVKALQQVLGIVEDGVFGPNTKRAVESFQARRGLVADGIVGRATAQALNWTFSG